jgi:hypothetical protein
MVKLPMLSHISLGTTDLDRARDFYDAAFKPLGYVRQWTSERGVEYGPEGGSGQFAIFLVATAHAPGHGFHLAVTANYAAFIRDLDGYKVEAVFNEG